ncbi:glycosyltransferase family 4 protein [Hyphomicrobium sulfonivorans]|uniref:glycosyltransferase family 4 protein n=1 Tax=Hyphomicrobium sulfonivorans TaxID=121290 RepID=UPI00156E97D9|nr:glycosyltransferase family 4 protein [Hyphomicrobium sulfonivorans]MBI1649584.1 glycosyltransferase family 4 protein [Hyphomicrobium sulfonivorans]NSL71500.1 hypothetical protein [Hyphomicrobium sulfonivorans]
MRILIVSQFFPPDITAAAFRIGDTADILAASGHDVAVVCAIPHKATAAGSDTTSATYSVERVDIAALRGSGVINYLRHYFSFVYGAIVLGRAVVRKLRPEVVWVSSPPLFVAIAGVALAKLARAPLVLDIRDVWPESAVAAKQISNGGAAFRIGKRLEQWAYRRADAITCVSNPMAEYIRGLTSTPVDVVYNGVRRSLVGSLPSADSAKDHSPNRTIIYAGNLGRAQGLETLVAAFAEIAQRPESAGWKLEFVGAGVLEGQLKQLASETAHADRIIFTPPMLKQDVMRHMSQGGLLFINLDADPVFEKTIPSKVFDYMLVGRPIIAGVAGEGAAILRETGGNIVFAPSDQTAMAAALLDGMVAWERLASRSIANRQVATDRYSREQSVVTLEQVFQRVVDGRSA